MNILKICGVALISAVAVGILKIYKSELAVTVGITAGAVILGAALSMMIPVAEYAEEISDAAGFSEYFAVVMKALGIALIADTASSVCRESGQPSLASKVEFAAKVTILALSFPIIKQICAAAVEVAK